MVVNVIELFENICENVFLVKIGIFIKENIRYFLKEKYLEVILNMIK